MPDPRPERAHMWELAARYGLVLSVTPGGAEYTGMVNGQKFVCAIDTFHDADDLARLQQALAAVDVTSRGNIWSRPL